MRNVSSDKSEKGERFHTQTHTHTHTHTLHVQRLVGKERDRRKTN